MSGSDKPSIFRTAARESASQVKAGLWRLFQMAAAILIVFGVMGIVITALSGILGQNGSPSGDTQSTAHSGGHAPHEEVEHKPKPYEPKPRAR